MTDVHGSRPSPGSQPAPGSQPTPGSQPSPGPDEASAAPRVLEATRRRAPRYRAFVGVGVAAGVLVALVLTFTRPETEYGYPAVFGYTAVVCGLLGALLGGLVAVVLDRRGRRTD